MYNAPFIKKIAVAVGVIMTVSWSTYAQMVAGSPTPRNFTLMITGDDSTDTNVRALQEERESKIARTYDTYRDRIKEVLGTTKIIETIPSAEKNKSTRLITSSNAVNKKIAALQEERDGILQVIRSDYRSKILGALGSKKIVRAITINGETVDVVRSRTNVATTEITEKSTVEPTVEPVTPTRKLSIYTTNEGPTTTLPVTTGPVVITVPQSSIGQQQLYSPKPVSVALCQANNPVIQAPGIGDGCSTKYGSFNLAVIPHIGIYKSTFTAACNNHDRCYTTLGYSTGKCNNDFLSEMKSACKSKFSRLWRPVEYITCTQTAHEYKAAVDIFARENNPGPDLQRALVSLSKQVQNDVKYGTCVTTPERMSIYSKEVISEVYEAFAIEANRKPDTNEFITTVADNYSTENYTLNTQGVKDYAKQRLMYKIPNGEVVLNDTILTIKNPLPGARYMWRINGYQESEGVEMNIPVEIYPRYDTETMLKGHVSVTLNGFSNTLIVDTVLHVRGECGKKSQKPCMLR